MFFDSKTIIATYLTAALLFLAVFVADGTGDLNQAFFAPLDNSYSVLGQHSVFKDYLVSKKVYAFLPFWNLEKDKLNLNYITDLSYFGLNVDAKGRIIKNDGSYNKWREDKKLTQAFKEIRNSGGSPSVTIICQDDDTIDSVLKCESCWGALAKDIETELTWAHIKDINIDFEYSGYTSKENSARYTKMVRYINQYLDKSLGNSFVVVSTFADSVERLGEDDVRISNPQELASAADAVFVMAYDFHQPTSNNAGPVSPLDGSYKTSKLNLRKTLDSYLKVISPSKIILGLPFYGYDWVVEDESVMAPRIEGNDDIGYSKVRTYSEVTDLLIEKRIKPELHKESQTYYFNYVDSETGSKHQVWYDGPETLKSKIDLATGKGLLGVGVWALGYEGGYSDLWKVFKIRS